MFRGLNSSVAVVDDDALVLESVSLLLKAAGFVVTPYDCPATALEVMEREGSPDVVVADINMPDMDGFQFASRFRTFDTDTPLIFITGNRDLETALSAIRLQAFAFLLKPFLPGDLIDTVRKGVGAKRSAASADQRRRDLERTALQRTLELGDALRAQQTSTRELTDLINAMVALRDEETGRHNSRIGLYAATLAAALGQTTTFIDNISLAATLHDIGKVGISSRILRKPGPLTSREFETIRTHTVIGHRMLAGTASPVLRMAATIALSHHERWDGGGYPDGLSGESIPLEGRIVMLADQYDALRSRRPYKVALDHREAIRILSRGDGRTEPGHFDPAVLTAFLDHEQEFARIFRDAPDTVAVPRVKDLSWGLSPLLTPVEAG